MKLKIEIEMDNAAFGNDPHSRLDEVMRILGNAEISLSPKEYGNLRDVNGNFVGTWKVTKR